MSVAHDLAKAKSFLRAGRVKDAQDWYHKILGVQPNNKSALSALATMERAGSDPVSRKRSAVMNQAMAEMKYQRALDALARIEAYEKTAPEHYAVLNLKGAIYARLQRFTDAVDVFERCLELRPDNIQVLDSLAKSLQSLGRVDEAIEHYEHALRLAPKNPSLSALLAQVYKSVGENEKGLAVLAPALEADPENVTLTVEEVRLKKLTPKSPEIERVTKLLNSDATSLRQKAQLQFSLAGAYEGGKDYEAAFEAYTEANAMRRGAFQYHLKADHNLFSRIKRVFAKPMPSADIKQQSPTPIFIVGMPRSGTTLTEQILGSHSKVHGAGELRWWAQHLMPIISANKSPELTLVMAEKINEFRENYQSHIAALSGGAPFVVDKMPLNFRFVGFMAAAFPEATILNMQRDPRATCWSIFTQNFIGNGNSYSFRLRETVSYFGMYLNLMQFWTENLPGRVVNVNYEKLTEDPETEARALLETCGLEWEPEVLEFYNRGQVVRTASVEQVRSKIYTGSSEKWRNYAPYIGSTFNPIGGLQ